MPRRPRPLRPVATAAFVTALAVVAAGVPAARAPRAAPAYHLAGASSLGLAGVSDATQVIEVTTSSYGQTMATLRAWTKSSSGWVETAGPWSAHIGRTGFAAPNAKREGDGHTPAGSYGLSFFFGTDPRPTGIRYAWWRGYSYDYWDDDSASSRYNLWTDTRRYYAGRSPEPMHVTPQYEDGIAIAYNTARRPGLGSAIFLHVTDGKATAGCIAIPRSEVLKLMGWLNPADHPRIIMGTVSEVRS